MAFFLRVALTVQPGSESIQFFDAAAGGICSFLGGIK